MILTKWCGLACILAFGLSVPASADAAPARVDKPNLLFILADDLGWADTTLYGQTKFYRTPNLERLARRGMTFTRAYSASPLCSPTRASIMTGLHPARIGITSPVCHQPEVILQPSPGPARPSSNKATACVSATRLKTEYKTLAESLKEAGYATGHFGKWHLGAEPYSPLQQGFDVDVPHYAGPGPAGSYVAPWKFPAFKENAPGEHLEDRMAKEAVAFMEAHQSHPFFLNYWMFSVHAPFNAKTNRIEQYRARIDSSDPQRCPTYAAMVESMDDAVGTLLDALDRLGLAENTVVVFFSDNGGNMYNEVDGTTPTSNAPLRGGKATLYEGGVRVPCVVCWPGAVAGGRRSDAVIQSIDFHPTLLEMLGLKPAGNLRFDGISIVPALQGKPLPRDALFTYFPHDPRTPDWLPPAVSVLCDGWKLIRIFHGGENDAHRWKLFDLANDPEEKRDLAAAEPARVNALDARIEAFLKDTRAVLPIPNPNFNPADDRPELEGIQPKPEVKPAPQSQHDWKARNCAVSFTNGVVTVRGTGPAPFLGFALGRDHGPAAVRMRIRAAAAGPGQIEGLASGATGSRKLPFDVKVGGWQIIRADIPADFPLNILRVYLPAQAQPVEVDWLEVSALSGRKPRRWDF